MGQTTFSPVLQALAAEAMKADAVAMQRLFVGGCPAIPQRFTESPDQFAQTRIVEDPCALRHLPFAGFVGRELPNRLGLHPAPFANELTSAFTAAFPATACCSGSRPGRSGRAPSWASPSADG